MKARTTSTCDRSRSGDLALESVADGGDSAKPYSGHPGVESPTLAQGSPKDKRARVHAMPGIPLRRLLGEAGLGLLLGYALLHPASMVIFQWLDPRSAHAESPDPLESILGPVTHSFSTSMLPMGFLFALLGAGITTSYGYFRISATAQRDNLERELALNEAYRAQLAERAELLRKQNRDLQELELANRRASQFIVHSFKTSLSCIRGFAVHLLDLPAVSGNAALADPIGRIGNQAQRMAEAVSDLLDLARLGAIDTLECDKIDAPDLLREAASEFLAPTSRCSLSLGQNQFKCPPAWGDRRLVLRVLTNLIDNALKHNGSGTTVVIDAEASKSNDAVIFTCCDNGRGIPDDLAPYVFKAFVSTGADQGRSSGLGLALCKAVADAHGGRIWFETSVGTGTRFLFRLPRYKEQEDESHVGEQEACACG